MFIRMCFVDVKVSSYYFSPSQDLQMEGEWTRVTVLSNATSEFLPQTSNLFVPNRINQKYVGH